ncbi:MAG TPA: TIR domain-containing protein [Candidatus Kapabacteria bacterium]|nr:TIR domain-containing protein [Candidatus Kapabacteria bacterium]
MGYKVFITYKYGDKEVYPLENITDTRVRDYVDSLQEILSDQDHINKGEADGTDLSDFKNSTIESKLRDKIYDSSITIVMISKNMMEYGKSEDDQWIPWEISYSLKEHSRDGVTSRTNAMLAVVLPDKNGSIDYFLVENSCTKCNVTMHNTGVLFEILRNNMFNQKKPDVTSCENHTGAVYSGYCSYIHVVKWSSFISDPDTYLKIAKEINDNIDQYDIQKQPLS